MSKNTFELVILRHGEAGGGYPDDERSLTDRGQQQILSQYQWLAEQGFKPDLILHSPYKRTEQTASLSEHTFPDVNKVVESLITPGGEPAVVAEFIKTLGKNRILIVSHMPFVSSFTSYLLPEEKIFGYPEAGLCWLKIDPDTNQNTLINYHWV